MTYLDIINDKGNITKIGFYFGSFDPFHNGHMEVAEVMSKYCDVIFITTIVKNSEKPQLSKYIHRINMIKNALKHTSKNIYFVEDNLINMINKLKSKYHLSGIMGSDVYIKFSKKGKTPKMKVNDWFIIPRKGETINPTLKFDKKTFFVDCNLFQKQSHSSTHIRKCIGTKNYDDNLPLCSENIKYIQDNNLYKTNTDNKLSCHYEKQ